MGGQLKWIKEWRRFRGVSRQLTLRNIQAELGLLVQEAVYSEIHKVPLLWVVENTEDEQLRPKLSGVKGEEARSSDTMTSKSPLVMEMPLHSIRAH
ncbi:hypothetical protein ElyMa_002145100 [Elysia marginata]|uniref:Uncharacterized protein n=1 Tax=Elysia marginata TaxID=1093978 RepID=A0AAV4FLR6_9GAST|nr:hypothetical protein ElyMa_002145100 [Elysia marginata]